MQEKPIALGRTAEIYAWENNTVLKLFFDWVSDEDIAYEAKIHGVIQKHFASTPKLLGEIEIDGRKGLILERIEGPNMRDEMLGHLLKAPKMVRTFAKLHTAVHKSVIPEFIPVKARLKRGIDLIEPLSQESKAKLLKQLDSLPDKKNLVHFDYHPGQIIVAPDGPVVIDWVTAGQGDPAADVARTIITIKFFSVPEEKFFTRLAIDLFVRWYCWSYPRQMCQLNPEISMEAVQAWMVPIAAARLNENVPGEKEKILAWLSKKGL